MDWLLEVRATDADRPQRYVFDALDRSEADAFASRILNEWRTKGERVGEVRFTPLPARPSDEMEVANDAAMVRWRAPLVDRP
ncbi:MAG: hypothetical protein ACYDCK_11965 [Thermoplasmatota archaeon]